MARLRISVLMIVSLLPVLLFYGCGKSKPESPGDKVVLKVNKYEMTADEFSDEARLIIPNKYLSADPDKANEELLNELITKQVLLQEAQKENFDKDRAFRKEIERYWEQALLKLLIKAKIAEFSQKMSGANSEIRQQKIQEALDGWIKSLRKRSDIKVYKNNLKKAGVK